MKHIQNVSFLVATAFISGMTLSGCNSSDSTGSPTVNGNTHAALLDACGLLTSSEAATVFGKPVLLVKGDTTNFVTHCSYVGDVAVGFFLPTHIDVTVSTTAGMQAHIPNNPVTASSLFASVKARTDMANLDGIGTDAVWQKKGGRVSFYKADVYVDVAFSPNGKVIDTSAIALEGSKAAAVKVAGRL